MIKYSSNYKTLNNNFIIKLAKTKEIIIDDKLKSSLCILENILQRGTPTKPSDFLNSKIGSCRVEDTLRYISSLNPKWDNTIKGYDKTNDFPAKTFFYDILNDVPELTFLQNLLLPETSLTDIIEDLDVTYSNQSVDFYLPQSKLVIEIDGIQHYEYLNSIKDKDRDDLLKKHGINVVRIPADKIKSYSAGEKDEMDYWINGFKKLCFNNRCLRGYNKFYINRDEYKNYNLAMEYDGVIRFQMLILNLIKNGSICLNDEVWKLEIKSADVDIPFDIAIEDFILWLKNILILQDIELESPKYIIDIVNEFSDSNDSIKIDFSLLKKWDEEIFDNDICYVRNDYFDLYNYFKVSTSNIVNYQFGENNISKKVDGLKFLLKNIFGFDDFRDGQLSIIINALKHEDTIGLLPTGSGKSLCYQFSLLLQPAVSIVVEPLSSLINDQAENVINSGINHVAYITSDLSAEEKKSVLDNYAKGKYFYIWVSPERFQSQVFRDSFEAIANSSNIGYAVIDEVHCLSEWGHDFRTSYLNLSDTIRTISPKTRFLGLTATASKNVIKDILNEMDMLESSVKTISNYTRKELSFEVIKTDNKSNLKFNNLIEIINKSNIAYESSDYSDCMVVFTRFVNKDNGSFGLYRKLNSIGNLKDKVNFYSGSVPKEFGNRTRFNDYKNKVQYDFKYSRFPLLTTTNAYGMGIDKKNIRYTVHYGIPLSLESFYQEAGRAGRDRKPSRCYVLHSRNLPEEAYEKIFKIDTSYDELNILKESLENKYGKSDDVLQNLFFVLSSQDTILNETELAAYIYHKYCSNDSNIISLTDLKRNFSYENGKAIEFVKVQRALYRLRILGIIKDWTIDDWSTGREKIKISCDKYITENQILNNLQRYINKYDIEFDIKHSVGGGKNIYYAILNSSQEFDIKNVLKMLITWLYDNIFYERRQSQKNLLDLCEDYFNKGPEYFKETLESYFKISLESCDLDLLVLNPQDIQLVSNLLFEDKKLKNQKVLYGLRIKLNRFLESYRYNTGLNLLSGLLTILLDDNLSSYKLERLSSAMSTIVELDLETKNTVLDMILNVSNDLSLENKNIISEILCYYYDDYKKIHTALGDEVTYCYILKENLNYFKNIRGDLDDKFRKNY